MLLSFLGWGSLAHAALAGGARADPGLRMVWGASLVAALAALLGAGSALSAGAATGLVALGAVMCAVLACAQRRAVERGARVTVRLVRRSPPLAAVAVPPAALIVVAFVGAASDWTRNPYDDDIAYIPFAKKLLDTGTLVEPFSHRRLTAYGGQTFFQAILSTRARFDQFNLFDRGVALAMTAVLVTFHRAGGKRARVEITLLVLALLYVLPSVSINGASYYSGLALFFGMYRTLEWQGEGGRVTARGAALTGLVAAATCSLRMSYIPVVAVLLAASYVAHPRRRRSSSMRELPWLGGSRRARARAVARAGVAVRPYVPVPARPHSPVRGRVGARAHAAALRARGRAATGVVGAAAAARPVDRVGGGLLDPGPPGGPGRSVEPRALLVRLPDGARPRDRSHRRDGDLDVARAGRRAGSGSRRAPRRAHRSARTALADVRAAPRGHGGAPAQRAGVSPEPAVRSRPVRARAGQAPARRAAARGRRRAVLPRLRAQSGVEPGHAGPGEPRAGPPVFPRARGGGGVLRRARHPLPGVHALRGFTLPVPAGHLPRAGARARLLEARRCVHAGLLVVAHDLEPVARDRLRGSRARRSRSRRARARLRGAGGRRRGAGARRRPEPGAEGRARRTRRGRGVERGAERRRSPRRGLVPGRGPLARGGSRGHAPVDGRASEHPPSLARGQADEALHRWRRPPSADHRANVVRAGAARRGVRHVRDDDVGGRAWRRRSGRAAA